MRRRGTSCLLLGGAVLGAWLGPVQAQEVHLSHVVDLPANDSLNLDPPRTSVGSLVRGRDGSWFYSGFVEAWKWAEYDSRGLLVRAPGKRFDGGGPGEFRRIDGVFPLRGDTVLVVERFAATRALRDGTFLDRTAVPLALTSWTRHRGRWWLAGHNSGSGLTMVRVDPSGETETFTLTMALATWSTLEGSEGMDHPDELSEEPLRE